MREYNYVPRPNVEYHYHIQDLINAQEKKAQDRNYHREKEKDKKEREDTISDAKLFIQTDFWCTKCKKDFKSTTIKEIEQDWSCPSQRIAFYKAKCFKGHWCIRYITDKYADGFWIRSKKVHSDRGTHYNDALQPFETGFNLLYGKK